MFRYEHLEEELVEAEYSIRSGQARRAMERLNYLLGQQEPEFEGYSFHCASVLRLMSQAARQFNDHETAKLLLERAVQLMRECEPQISAEYTENFISLAEFLASEHRHTEAMQLADLALECMVAKNNLFMVDDLADFLRRYARVAKALGYLQYATTRFRSASSCSSTPAGSSRYSRMNSRSSPRPLLVPGQALLSTESERRSHNFIDSFQTVKELRRGTGSKPALHSRAQCRTGIGLFSS